MRNFLFAAIAWCFFTGGINAQSVNKYYVDGKIYLKYRKGAFPQADRSNPRNIPLGAFSSLESIFSRYGVVKVHKPFYQATDDDNLPNILKVEFTDITKVDQFTEELAQVRGIEYAEKVPLMLIHATPNDPVFPVHLTQINANNAWNIFNGSSQVRVAIVDNAVMWNHADLQANIYINTGETPANGIDDDNNGYIDDVNGFNVADNNNNPAPTNLSMDHGTHCAGIAGAVTDNSVGIASIGWNIKIIPVQCEPDNSTNMLSVTSGYEGILYAARAGARVISCSWGNNGSALSEQYVVTYAWDRGAIVMASAGNFNTSTPQYPAAYNNVYCVASVDNADVKSGFSNYGSWVDISAPGNNVMSTAPYTGTLAAYQSMSGTSMSTPLVAGLAGLMLSKSPQMTRQDILNCISATAVNIYSISGNSAYISGSQLGAGRIEALLAMSCAATFSATLPVANFYGFPLNTCPGSVVNFYDSSRYLPATRSWTFQGGSPATSTLVNPAITYTANGTYSVGLTVTNGNGSNTKTKISYITVSGPSSLPFFEGFQSTTFPPAGWTWNNIWNDGQYWQRKAGPGGFGLSNASAWYDNYDMYAPNERDELRTPRLNFSNVASARLRFDVSYAQFNNNFSDTLEVKMSSNCGASWTSIYLKGGSTLATASNFTAGQFTPTAADWRRDSIDVSVLGAGQPNVMFSFINRGHYGQPIYLDNINLVLPTPTVDAVVPATACEGNPVSFTNTSIGASTYTWVLPGTSAGTSTLTHPVVTYTAAGVYTIFLTGDNGTVTSSVTKTITILGSPTISISGPTICAGSSATLVPTGASTFSFYNQSGSLIATSASAVITPTASTIYSISGSNGTCTGMTTVAVTVINNPTISAQSFTICSGVSATLVATGATSYTWSTNQQSPSIVVSPTASSVYTVIGETGGCISAQTVSVDIGTSLSVFINASQPGICVGGSATLTASGASSFTWGNGSTGALLVVTPSVTTTYTVDGLSGTCSGTAGITVSVSPTPTLIAGSVPAGTVCTGSSVTLTASGATTYSWNTGQTGSAVVVTPTSSTVYTVTGSNNGCAVTETVGIATGNATLIIAVVANQSLSCGGSPVILTASGASTYSWNTGATSLSVVVTPTSTTSYTVTGFNSGCTGMGLITVSVSGKPLSVLTTTSSSCGTGCNGVVNAVTSGGSGPLTYSINGSACTSMPCSGLCPGFYTLLTSDSLGCSSVNYFLITTSSNTLQAVTTSTNASCGTCNDGAIAVNAMGGVQPYTYVWSPSGGTNAIATGISTGCYTVTITDAGGCVASASVCISVTGLDSQTANQTLMIYPNPANGFFRIETANAFDYTLYNHLGQLLQTGTSTHNSLVVNVTGYAKGIYHLSVKVNGVKISRKIVIGD
jgi:serine protease